MIVLSDYLLFLDGKTKIPLLNGDKLSFSYTLKNEDIRDFPKPALSPYQSHKAYFDNFNKVNISSRSLNEGLEITINVLDDIFSEWGINLPFNFMGKKNGGGYRHQYLFNSPYKDDDCKNNYLYLSNPDGHNLIIVLKTEGAYWKMDYSTFCGGHFFTNLKLLGQLDKLYEPSKQNNKELIFFIKEVKDFDEALFVVSSYLNKPLLTYDLSGGKITTKINVSIFGKCDVICDGEKSYKISDDKFVYEIKREGITTLTPYYKNTKGLACTLYGYSTIKDLYNKSIHAIDFNDILVTDGNLCEHQCYISATLRYLLKYGKNEEYEKIALKGLSVICETDINKAKKRITIFNKPQPNGYPAYHVFGSNRIQEQFFGVTILLDAYRYFKDDKYLIYAINSLNTLIDYYQNEDGGFYAKMEWNKYFDDYSTVTCLIIPIIDMALFMKDINSELSLKYELSARRLAQHVFARGLNFPTETLISDDYEPEMEDGSISCSALTLLYFYNKIEQKHEYLLKAKEILDFHENWVVRSPLCNAYHSSLRWWETNWEGDGDGPALCLGHAWTIWRAEADYWMYKASNDEKYLLNAKNSFNTNFAKINKIGQSFSIFCIDYITGGGFDKPNRAVSYKIASNFPKQTDSGLSRYVWIRGSETILDYLK